MYNSYGYYPNYYNHYPPNYNPYYNLPNYWNSFNRYDYPNYINQNRRNYPMNRNRYYIGEDGLEDRKENYKEDNYFRRSRNSYNYNYDRNNYNKYDRYSDNNDRFNSYNNDYNRYNRGYWKEEEKKDNKKSENDLILDYENTLRKEIELTTPLISDELPISKLTEEYKSNEEYLKSIENISKKYKTYRKVRRDGNCFYRSFIYRLF
jgi:hypothetical protein